jgi:hypothetical protein
MSKETLKLILITILGGLFVALFVWGFQLLKEYEHRLTQLETKFETTFEKLEALEACVDCSQRTKKIGDYPYEIIKGVDVASNGEVLLETDIDVLSEQFRWECGSFVKIVRGKKESADLANVISQYKADAQLKGVKAIVVVGTASQEGNFSGEEKRAKDRIETLINLTQDSLNTPNQIPIYGLNFGKSIENIQGGCDDTIDQRRIVLLKVLKRSDNLPDSELEASLKRILLAKATDYSVFPVDIRKYSMFSSGQKMLVSGRK